MNIRDHQKYVEDNQEEFDKVKFYCNPSVSGIHAVYYNPDSSHGGQIVDSYVNITDLKWLLTEYGNDREAFFEGIDECARQTLLDIDHEEFLTGAEFFVNNFGNQHKMAEGETLDTIAVIKSWAEDDLAEKTTESDSIEKLALRLKNFLLVTAGANINKNHIQVAITLMDDIISLGKSRYEAVLYKLLGLNCTDLNMHSTHNTTPQYVTIGHYVVASDDTEEFGLTPGKAYRVTGIGHDLITVKKDEGEYDSFTTEYFSHRDRNLKWQADD